MTLQQFIEAKKAEFDKGYFTFQFEFYDKEDKWHYETCTITDDVSQDVGYKMAQQHVKEFGVHSLLRWFVENKAIKTILSAALREAVTQAFEAVRVEKHEEGQDIITALDRALESRKEGFNIAIEAVEKKINDYLK